jgi:O-antigen/teichoic acid export membrane protein
MEKTLKEKTAHGLLWSFIDRFGQQAIYIVVGILLARIFLNPTDYGLNAMVVVFNLLGCTLVDSGFSNALIRKRDTTQIDLSSVFYFNIVCGLLLYIIIFLFAPVFAWYYERPILTSLVRVISLGIPLSAFALIQTVLLSKAINFKLLARINILALLCAGIISLILAWQGFGVWVLVIQPISLIVFRNIGLWSFNKWRPNLEFHIQSIKNLWQYSSKLLASSSISIIFDNLYALLIAKFYPIHTTGFYAQAKKYSEVPNVMVPAIQGVTYPALVQTKDDDKQLKRAFRKTIRVFSFIYIPVMTGLIAIAESLVFTVLGAKWLPIIPYLRIICLGLVFLGGGALYANILYIKGLSSAILKFNLFYRALLVLGIIFTLRFGIIPLLITGTGIGIVYAIVMALFAGSKINYTFMEQFKDIVPYFFLALLMGIGIYMWSFVIENLMFQLLIQVISGATFYLGAAYLLGSMVFREAIDMVRNKMLKT